ncbi:hypothetical protein E3N88_37755 [Mikania micrantha]|uniref:Helicase C-terminal domain-containing protein n=1 Tax=Mikania micrantha TaxID=192012 RepID=A0A5N6LS16_9ASTR|nr:hypothetical protein E3N88_37755 [Mikania micrantha]
MREGNQQVVLLALCSHTFISKKIIFSGTKQPAHRLKILLGFAGLKVVELHENLTQALHLDALELFRRQEIEFLIGLDIIGVQVVINYECLCDLTRQDVFIAAIYHLNEGLKVYVVVIDPKHANTLDRHFLPFWVFVNLELTCLVTYTPSIVTQMIVQEWEYQLTIACLYEYHDSVIDQNHWRKPKFSESSPLQLRKPKSSHSSVNFVKFILKMDKKQAKESTGKLRDLRSKKNKQSIPKLQKTTTSITSSIQHNSEDDFESPLPRFLQYDLQRRIRIRNSPLSLYTFIQSLNTKQKAAVNKIGFGSILELKITSLPTCLGHWLLANYDSTTCRINLGSHVIKIIPQLVKEVLGIPMGSTKLKELGKPSIRDLVVAEFRSQFPEDIVLPDIKDLVYANDVYQRQNPKKKKVPGISFNTKESLNELDAQLIDEQNIIKQESTDSKVKGKANVDKVKLPLTLVNKKRKKRNDDQEDLQVIKKKTKTKNENEELISSFIVKKNKTERSKGKKNNVYKKEKKTTTSKPKSAEEWVVTIEEKTKELDNFVKDVEFLIIKCFDEIEDDDKIFPPIEEWMSRLTKYKEMRKNEEKDDNDAAVNTLMVEGHKDKNEEDKKEESVKVQELNELSLSLVDEMIEAVDKVEADLEVKVDEDDDKIGALIANLEFLSSNEAKCQQTNKKSNEEKKTDDEVLFIKAEKPKNPVDRQKRIIKLSDALRSPYRQRIV